jgi:hypothetical protein
VNTDVLEETKKMNEGKWQCSFGTWHTKGWDCHCGDKLVFDETTKTYRLQEIKTITNV